jgi:RimJ/RimL family protein N-acetyltransferase
MKTLRYRLAHEGDVKILANWWRDGEIMEHAGFPYGLKIDEDKLKERLQKQEASNHQVFIIEYGGEAIGEMGVKKQDIEAEIGIKICHRNHQNKGLGTNILNQLLENLFEQEGIKLVSLDTMLENKRAQKVYERIGFRKVKTEDNVFVDQLGKNRSAVFYEMTKEDYRNL